MECCRDIRGEGVGRKKERGACRTAENGRVCEANGIDKVLVTELSRLGRDTLQVLEVIEMLNTKRISLYINNYHIETLTEGGKVNPMSQFLVTILAEVARMERKTIKERAMANRSHAELNLVTRIIRIAMIAATNCSRIDMTNNIFRTIPFFFLISQRKFTKLSGRTSPDHN